MLLLKKLYDPPEKDADGKELPPRVRGVRVQRAGKIQRLTPAYIASATREGWLTQTNGEFVIRAESDELAYRIVTPPGLYCCHCGKPQGDSATAKAHVASEHKDTKSPDPTNPAGYRQDNFFETLLAGDAIDRLTDEEAVTMLAGVRASLIEKISKKYGDTRGAAARRNAAKGKAATGGPSNG